MQSVISDKRGRSEIIRERKELYQRAAKNSYGEAQKKYFQTYWKRHTKGET